jgi:hypothetical protein
MTTTNQHLITPPPELVQQWASEWMRSEAAWPVCRDNFIATQAAQWGADQELKACCNWFQDFYTLETWMERDLKAFRAARRHKPPSLVQRALHILGTHGNLSCAEHYTIRRALEALPND